MTDPDFDFEEMVNENNKSDENVIISENFNTDTSEIGKTSPKRGEEYLDLAEEHLKTFPIGQPFSVSRWSYWLHNQGQFPMPNNENNSSGAIWNQYVRDRAKLKNNVNKAGQHDKISQKFHIAVLRNERWLTETLDDAIYKTSMRECKKIKKHFICIARRLRYMSRSVLNDPKSTPEQITNANIAYQSLLSIIKNCYMMIDTAINDYYDRIQIAKGEKKKEKKKRKRKR